MSQETPQAGTSHYMALCGLCLGIVFLTQLQLGLIIINLLGVMIGIQALVSKLRLGPLLLVIFVAAGQFSLEPGLGRHFGPGSYREPLDLQDVLLCAALLGYVIGHYRLQAIWYHILPTDVRQRAQTPRRRWPWFWKRSPLLLEQRPGTHITAKELALLVVTLPVWALLGQVAWALLPQRWNLLGLPMRLVQILVVLWILAIGGYLTTALLTYWKYRQHDPATAQLYLQDQLWRETRGEQRRVNRWLAWWRLTKKQDKKDL
jgi:hypothetical protein